LDLTTDDNQQQQQHQQHQQQKPDQKNTISSREESVSNESQQCNLRKEKKKQIKWLKETPAQQRERFIRQLRAELTVNASDGGRGGGASRQPFTEADHRSTVNYSVDENPERGNWSGRLDFVLSCLGYAVGLGNFWRFPYLCFSNGGGAFLIPYAILLLLCGIPVFPAGPQPGTVHQRGPGHLLGVRAHLHRCLGYSMVFLSTTVSTYYNIIISISIYYTFASMTSTLPWNNCSHHWNTNSCTDRLPFVSCGEGQPQPNGTCYNGTIFLGIYNESLFQKTTGLRRILASEEYFNREVLKVSGDINKFGSPDWKLVMCLLLSWIVIFLSMIRGIKSSGKVVYFTALFPYVILLIFFIRGVTLENAIEGIRFYIVPDFSALGKARVWKDAAGQIFFSLSCSWGGLMSLSSYNRFHNNVIRDTFFRVRWLRHIQLHRSPGWQSKGAQFGLAFIVYPEVMNLLPGSNYWSILFFIMIFSLGIDSQFGLVETLITALYLSGWIVLLVGFMECILVGWVYGRPGFGKFHRFTEDIALMMRQSISVADLGRTEYTKGKGDYYPIWADALGWLLSVIPLLIIVGTGLSRLLMEPVGISWWRRLRDLSIPTYTWGPAIPRYRLLMAPYLEKLGVLKYFYLDPKRNIKFIDVFPIESLNNMDE
uniref:Transporter n=1 Tax=Macrostomum lignano TaxID=282301 RepID=A0A1I8HK84_9PLAT